MSLIGRGRWKQRGNEIIKSSTSQSIQTRHQHKIFESKTPRKSATIISSERILFYPTIPCLLPVKKRTETKNPANIHRPLPDLNPDGPPAIHQISQKVHSLPRPWYRRRKDHAPGSHERRGKSSVEPNLLRFHTANLRALAKGPRMRPVFSE